jgi:predicted amidophosphoribosyltransferase
MEPVNEGKVLSVCESCRNDIELAPPICTICTKEMTHTWLDEDNRYWYCRTCPPEETGYGWWNHHQPGPEEQWKKNESS